jgi:hypothetical protein
MRATSLTADPITVKVEAINDARGLLRDHQTIEIASAGGHLRPAKATFENHRHGKKLDL